MYGGLMGAFLLSGCVSNFDFENHPWQELGVVMMWWWQNNSLFRRFTTLTDEGHVDIRELDRDHIFHV